MRENRDVLLGKSSESEPVLWNVLVDRMNQATSLLLKKRSRFLRIIQKLLPLMRILFDLSLKIIKVEVT